MWMSPKKKRANWVSFQPREREGEVEERRGCGISILFLIFFKI